MSLAVGLNSTNMRCSASSVSTLNFFCGTATPWMRRAEPWSFWGCRPWSFPASFPMDISRWLGEMWAVSHKPAAMAVGLGQIGLNRLLLHPRLGGFLTLGTALLDTSADCYDQLLDYNLCLDCKLCVAACPVGAIADGGGFSFVNCLTHS
ncbi:hypothetical protein DFAR_2520007 [Desulfarculales bacterium]